MRAAQMSHAHSPQHAASLQSMRDAWGSGPHGTVLRHARAEQPPECMGMQRRVHACTECASGAGRGGTHSVAMAAWANAAGEAPSALLQQLAALARQDLLRFEVDSKPTLAFQVGPALPGRLPSITHLPASFCLFTMRHATGQFRPPQVLASLQMAALSSRMVGVTMPCHGRGLILKHAARVHAGACGAGGCRSAGARAGRAAHSGGQGPPEAPGRGVSAVCIGRCFAVSGMAPHPSPAAMQPAHCLSGSSCMPSCSCTSSTLLFLGSGCVRQYGRPVDAHMHLHTSKMQAWPAGSGVTQSGSQPSPAQGEQEAHMRAAVAAYFESEEAPLHGEGQAGASAEQDGNAAAALEGLPLAAKSGFLAKDARMLLRETAAKLVRCFPCLPAVLPRGCQLCSRCTALAASTGCVHWLLPCRSLRPLHAHRVRLQAGWPWRAFCTGCTARPSRVTSGAAAASGGAMPTWTLARSWRWPKLRQPLCSDCLT